MLIGYVRVSARRPRRCPSCSQPTPIRQVRARNRHQRSFRQADGPQLRMRIWRGSSPWPNACKLNDRQRQALVNIVERGPMPAIHGVVRWRLKDLAMWVWEEFRISLSETTLSRELRSLGYRKLSARPRHYAQNPEFEFGHFGRVGGRSALR